MDPLYVSVIGAGQCEAAERALAEEVGRLVAKEGATLICGGLGGVMEAAARGAKEAGGVTIGILPGHSRSTANPHIDHVITTGLGHARNLAVVSSGDAVIAIGGRYGTLSEIGLAATIGRPVVILGGWRLQNEEGTGGIWYAGTPAEAIALVRAALEHPALWREEQSRDERNRDERDRGAPGHDALGPSEQGPEEPGREEPLGRPDPT